MIKHLTPEQAAQLREALAGVGKMLRDAMIRDPVYDYKMSRIVTWGWDCTFAPSNSERYILLPDESDLLDILEAEGYIELGLGSENGRYGWWANPFDDGGKWGEASTRLDALFECVLEVMRRKGEKK